MLLEKINSLKAILESQIKNNVEYSKIYETSVKIDKLLVDYYLNKGSLVKKF